MTVGRYLDCMIIGQFDSKTGRGYCVYTIQSYSWVQTYTLQIVIILYIAIKAIPIELTPTVKWNLWKPEKGNFTRFRNPHSAASVNPLG